MAPHSLRVVVACVIAAVAVSWVEPGAGSLESAIATSFQLAPEVPQPEELVVGGFEITSHPPEFAGVVAALIAASIIAFAWPPMPLDGLGAILALLVGLTAMNVFGIRLWTRLIAGNYRPFSDEWPRVLS